MFGERCTLCGGKLDSKKVCKECGLDNSKSEKYYRINQSSCDGKPLTHVHEEKKEKPKERKQTKQIKQVKQVKTGGQQSYRQKPKKKKGKKTSLVALIPVLFVGLSILGTLVDSFTEIFTTEYEDSYEDSYSEAYEDTYGEIYDETYDETYIESDPYENVEAVLPEGDESVAYSLENGDYIVGVHIAPGSYRVKVQNDVDAVFVRDIENGIYLHEYQSNINSCRNDFRLYPGARVNVRAKSPVDFTCENAYTEGLTGMKNPVAGSYMFNEAQQVTAGKDIEPGVYDVSLQGGEGLLQVIIYDENGEECKTQPFYFYNEGITVYRNLVIPENAVITCEAVDNMTYTLTASEMIGSTDYLGYYTEY